MQTATRTEIAAAVPMSAWETISELLYVSR